MAGFFIEVAGVKTGLIFGEYEYGNTLGFKLFDTPLLIGFNWLFLTYTSIAIIDHFKLKSWLTIFLAPLVMLVYDIVLEQVASKMGMWYWKEMQVPIKNYIAWYLTGFIFVMAFRIVKIETKNPLAIVLLISQFIFFAVLTIILK